MTIINLYPNFHNHGGAQNVVLELHKFLCSNHFSIVSGFTNKNRLYSKYHNGFSENYKPFKLGLVFKNRNSLFISHHRKITSFLLLLDKFFFLNLKIIHVAHNEFHSLKILSFFPRRIIAVSERVKLNHVEFFEIPRDNITVIYNGVQDISEKISLKTSFNKISILYPARLNAVKRQVDLIQNLMGNLREDVLIDFAGVGEDEEELKKLCENNSQFRYLGFINLQEIITDYDYVMLFSKNEGLPLSLIEAGMYGKPVITNNVGGNTEIIKNNINGFVRDNYQDLISVLNELPDQSPDQYSDLCKNARRIYKEKFTSERMISEYNKYLGGIIGEKMLKY